MTPNKSTYANAVCAALYLYRTTKGESRQPWLDMLKAHDEWLKCEHEEEIRHDT